MEIKGVSESHSFGCMLRGFILDTNTILLCGNISIKAGLAIRLTEVASYWQDGIHLDQSAHQHCSSFFPWIGKREGSCPGGGCMVVRRQLNWIQCNSVPFPLPPRFLKYPLLLFSSWRNRKSCCITSKEEHQHLTQCHKCQEVLEKTWFVV